MEQIVIGCNDCPMNNNMYDGWGSSQCNHPNIFGDEGNNDDDTSDMDDGQKLLWCPLKKEPITICISEK